MKFNFSNNKGMQMKVTMSMRYFINQFPCHQVSRQIVSHRKLAILLLGRLEKWWARAMGGWLRAMGGWVRAMGTSSYTLLATKYMSWYTPSIAKTPYVPPAIAPKEAVSWSHYPHGHDLYTPPGPWPEKIDRITSLTEGSYGRAEEDSYLIIICHGGEPVILQHESITRSHYQSGAVDFMMNSATPRTFTCDEEIFCQ